MDRSLERLLLREGVMHGWGHARNKGVAHLNLRNVPESQTDSSGFPTFYRLGGEGVDWGNGFVAGWCKWFFLCRLAGKMGSFGKKADLRRLWVGRWWGLGGKWLR